MTLSPPVNRFGPYFDTYTIKQAVQDGATVPIFYESRLPERQVIGQNIDQVFDRVFEERAVIKQRFATEEAIASEQFARVSGQRRRRVLPAELRHFEIGVAGRELDAANLVSGSADLQQCGARE